VALNQRPQLGDQLAIASERQIRLHPLLERGQLELLQLRDRRLRERLVGEVRQRRTPPQPQRLAQNPRGLPGVPSRQRVAPVVNQRAEAIKIELARRDAKEVAMPTSHQCPVDRGVAIGSGSDGAVGTERLAQPRDLRLQGLRRSRRRSLAPQIVDQTVDGDDLASAQQQHSQQRPLLVAPQLERAITIANLERAENPIVHTLSLRSGRRDYHRSRGVCARANRVA
jgi:hypothetical protein